MRILNQAGLQGNAYRRLRLSAAATQAGIDAAARMLRLLGQAAPAAADLLGPVKGDAQEIESAVMRLGEPGKRLRERVWWFCGRPPATAQEASDLLDAAEQDAGQSAPLWHDAMLVHLWRALAAGESGDLEAWRLVLRLADEMSRSMRYQEWMTAVEQFGDFEKRATRDEIEAAQWGMSAEVAAQVAVLGESALAQHNSVRLEKALGLLNESGRGAEAAEEQLLNHIDAEFSGRSQALRADISAAWQKREAGLMKHTCHEVMRKFASQLASLRGILLKHYKETDRGERINGEAAGLLEFAAQALEAAFDKDGALLALQRAVALAEGTSLWPRIRAHYDRLYGELHGHDVFRFQRKLDLPNGTKTWNGEGLLATVGANVVLTAGTSQTSGSGQSPDAAEASQHKPADSGIGAKKSTPTGHTPPTSTVKWRDKWREDPPPKKNILVYARNILLVIVFFPVLLAGVISLFSEGPNAAPSAGPFWNNPGPSGGRWNNPGPVSNEELQRLLRSLDQAPSPRTLPSEMGLERPPASRGAGSPPPTLAPARQPLISEHPLGLEPRPPASRPSLPTTTQPAW